MDPHTTRSSDARTLVWTVVLPVKGGPASKSRLAATPALARAIALDAVEAVLAAGAVARAVVVTADALTAAATATLGAHVVPESDAGGGLDAAVRDGLDVTDGPVAVLLADLPALRAQDVDAALHAASTVLAGSAAGWLVVPDADGTGTVMLAGLQAHDVRPAFGPGSAAAHERLGAVRFAPDLPRLRRDVDTPADLAAARAMGLGPRTAAAAVYADGVQATVHAFDPARAGGSVVLDDGTLLPFGADAFAVSGLRHVRTGQRLSVEVDGEGASRRVVALHLGTVGRSPLTVRSATRRQSRS